MGETMAIYIDDTGQLHPNYPKGPVFLYAGFWTSFEKMNEIKNFYGVLRYQIFHTRDEVKGSTMNEKTKLNIIRRIKNKFPDDFHPIFVAVNVPDLSIDFGSKRAVQLHKNYLLRRFVETAIQDKRNKCADRFDFVNVYIDDQSKTRLPNYDSLESYLNKSAKHQYSWNKYPAQSKAKFTVSYEDSQYDNGIQLADVLANAKGRYYNGNQQNSNVKNKFELLGINAPLKLPKFWLL
ncbi:DUF3800 domain-containing protein [Weissella confusa]|uniref:DUF3800 domain-containing protein n=1 Tax=Weissella confusa TaxID=1583 RepID=UPI00107F961A|nr:DUF3800 domain-containing protein [Weissella confusa]TGE66733.1 hypothetical protein C6P17_02795 [Weissella confusa]